MVTIPLTSDPNQSFRCTIPVDGRNLTLGFRLHYNPEAAYWAMTLVDDVTGQTLISSLPLLAGQYPSANLLAPYAFLRIGSAVLIKTHPDNPDVAPNDQNLGTDFILVWSDTMDEG